ncbi:MAG: NAD(P)-binding domain-containing protein [Acidimicrobiales bacterium]
MTSTAYNLVIVGGTAGALSVAISSQRSGLGLVRVLAAGNEVAFPALVGSEQLDIGYGEPVSSIDLAADGEHLVVTTAKQTYDTRAVMVAQRPPTTDWKPPLPVPEQRVHVDQVPDDVGDLDVLVIGTTDHAVEVATALSSRGARVVLAAGGMDPGRLSPSAERMLRRLERDRRATLLYRSTPESIGEVDGYPMVYFGDRRTPDLQFDHVVFAPPRRTLEPAALGITAAAVGSGRVWFQGTSEAETGQQVSPGWRIGLDIARSCFPELDLPEPTPPTERLRRHSGAIEELRAEHYNATITQFEPTHSDLWVLRVKADLGDTSHIPGQYASLGLGYWEDRIDNAEDPGLDQRWDKLIRRSYSISNRIFDEHGYLADDTAGDELEFYIVLVPPTDDNIPALTPRLALKRPGDRIYLGPKVAGRYTLNHVLDPEATVLLLSTGTGEAPHNSMAVELLRKGHVGPIVAAVSVRQWADLGYLDKHRSLERRYANYHYLPMPTREPDVPKRYIQDLLVEGTLTEQFGVTLDPATTHVFLCGNPAMIGLPADGPDGSPVFPETTGVVELLTKQGFTLDHRNHPGNIHYEEYW